MKPWFRPTAMLCLAILLSLVGMPNGAAAQDGQARFITEASIRLTRLAGAATKEGYALQANSLSVGGAWVNQSKNDWVSVFTLKLEKGKQYRFLAAGDEDAKDVDLEILDAAGKVVARDLKTDPEAVVDFMPDTTGTYVVRIRLYDSAGQVPCLCLALAMTKRSGAK